MRNHYSFRLRHETADFESLSEKIPLKLGRVIKKDEPRTDGKGVVLDGVYAESYCIFKFDKDVDSLREAVAILHNIFLNLDLNLAVEYPGIRQSVYCTMDGVGEVVDIPCLKILCELDISLEID